MRCNFIVPSNRNKQIQPCELFVESFVLLKVAYILFSFAGSYDINLIMRLMPNHNPMPQRTPVTILL
jgi:hypothetical protein